MRVARLAWNISVMCADENGDFLADDAREVVLGEHEKEGVET
jgi:hypothetical protein